MSKQLVVILFVFTALTATKASTFTTTCTNNNAVTFYSYHYTACIRQVPPTFTGINNNSTNGYSYQWYHCIDVNGTNPSIINGASSLNYSPDSMNESGVFYYFITSTCIGGSSVSSSVITLTVYAAPTNVVAQPSTINICQGNTISLSASGISNETVKTTYNESFDSGVTVLGTPMPFGWSFINAATGGNQWGTSSVSRSGNSSMYYDYFGARTNANAWAISKGVFLHAGDGYKISFYYKTSGGTNYPEKLKVTVGNTAIIASQTTTIWQNGSATVAGGGSTNGGLNITDTAFTKGSAIFYPSTDGVYYFGWNCISDVNMEYLYIDDIAIEYIAPQAINNWTWTSTSNFTASSQNPTNISPVNGEVFTVTATNINGCQTSTSSPAITVNALPPSPGTANNGSYSCGSPTFIANSVSNNSTPSYKWYNSQFGGSAITNQYENSYTPSTFLIGVNQVYVTEISPEGCESNSRTKIAITASMPPNLHALSNNNLTTCLNKSIRISVSASTISNYSNYTWFPINYLYLDSACTQAYTKGTNVAVVFAKPSIPDSIVFTCFAHESNCTNTASATIHIQNPPTIIVQPKTGSGCGTINKTLTFSANSILPLNFQWQMSNNGTDNWTNVNNGTAQSVSYSGNTKDTLNINAIKNPYYYKAIINDGVCSSIETNTVLITAGIPSIIATTNASVCNNSSQGNASVSATGTAGSSVNWFSNSTGGIPIGSGNSFSSTINNTTTFYAEPYFAANITSNLGYSSEISTNLRAGGSNGMFFSSTNAVEINSIDIYPSNAGPINIILKDDNGTTIDTRSFTIGSGELSKINKKTLTFTPALNIPAGSAGWSLNYDLSVNRGGNAYTYPQSTNGFNITGNTFDGNNITDGSRWYLFNWVITNSGTCTGSRIAATATILPNVWTGNLNTNWNNNANWSCNIIPTDGQDITIPVVSNNNYPTLVRDVIVGNLNIDPAASLSINGNMLTVLGEINNTGKIAGSSTSSLILNNKTSNTLNLRSLNPTDTLLGSLILNGSGKVTLGSGVGISSLLSLNNAAAILDLNNNHLTLKSTSLANTAEVGAVAHGASIINGNVTVERFIPKEYRNYRDLGASVANAGSVFANWQESGAAGSNVYNGFFITGTAAKGSPYLPGKIFETNSGLDYTTVGAPSMYTYIGTTWPAVTSTKALSLNPFQGYRAIVRGARNFNMGTNPNTMPTATTLRTTGKLVTGDVTITTAGTVVADNNSYNSSFALTTGSSAYSLIANPYACPVQWSKVLGHSSIYNTYWYLDPTYQDPSTGYQRYITVQYSGGVTIVTPNPKGGSSADASFDYIQSGQGFMVNNYGNATPSISFKEADKITGATNNDVFKQTTPSLMSIELYKNNSLADAAVANFNNSFTKAIGTEDASKMMNSGENISITESSSDLSIDGLPKPSVNDVLPVRLGQLKANTTYQLKADISNFTTAGLQAYVRDNMLNTEVAAGSFISFTPTSVDIQSYKDRFSVVFKQSKVVVPVVTVKGSISVFPNPVTAKSFKVQTSNIAAGKYNVVMVNCSGQEVMSTPITHVEGSNTETITMNKALTSGVYTLVLKSAEGKTLYQTELLAK